MRYALLVTGPAYGRQHATSAWMFAKALTAAGHNLESIFFYQEGVMNANHLVSAASDEHALIDAWVELSQAHEISLNICVSAALRRGVSDASSSQAVIGNLHSGFHFSGLGELAQAALTCDRLVQF